MVEQGHVRGHQMWKYMRFTSTSQKYIRLLSKSLQLPMWGSRVWGKAWDLSTVASNHELLSPYSSPLLFPLSSSKAISVINDNLQSHTFTCPFWEQIVTIFCQPPNNNLFHGQEKRQTHMVKISDRNWISHWVVGFHVDYLRNCEEFTYLLTMKFSSARRIRNKYVQVYFRPHMFRFYKI